MPPALETLGMPIKLMDAQTARHVVDGFADIYEGTTWENLNGEGTFSLQAFQFLENGTKSRAWDVRQIYMAPNPTFTDIVFLRLQPTNIKATREMEPNNILTIRFDLLNPSDSISFDILLDGVAA